MKSLRTIKMGLPIMVTALFVAVAVSSTRAESPHTQDKQGNAPAKAGKLAKATFAGGCFWCMEPPFEKLPGVVYVTSGYTGGPEKSPSYEEVSSGRTGHVEAVQVEYDPKRISYEYLLEVFYPQSGVCHPDAQTLRRVHLRVHVPNSPKREKS